MAMLCCTHHGAPVGVRHDYGMSVEPVGYPNPAVLCCRRGCHEPGLVWLNKRDMFDYHAGQRDIIIWGQSIKVRVV